MREHQVLDQQERVRKCTTHQEHGQTLNEILEQAEKKLDQFFGKGKWEYVEVQARPAAQALGGGIFLWEADVSACEVWV